MAVAPFWGKAVRSCGLVMMIGRMALAIPPLYPRAIAPGAAAHEIPADVKINAFVKPAGDRLDLLIRVPLSAAGEVDLPTHGPGYLDISEADEALRDATKLLLTDNIEIFENGALLAKPRIVQARVSLSSDRSFISFEKALAHLSDPPLPDTLDLYWSQ